VNWEPNKYATFELSGINANAVAKWIDRYFVRILGCEACGYDVDVTIGDQSDG